MTQPRIRRDWAKPRVQREKVEQAHGVQLLRSLGAAVYVSGTHRKKGDFQGTMQTPGIPDVEAWLPQPPASAGLAIDWSAVRKSFGVTHAPRLLKWEVKAAGGTMSPAQREYQALCVAAGVAHVCGDVDTLIAWLIQERYLKPENVPHYRGRPGMLDGWRPKA